LSEAPSQYPGHLTVSRKIWRFLERFNPDAVQVYGLRASYSWPAIIWAKRHNRKVLLVTDGELRAGVPRRKKIQRLLTIPPALTVVDAALAGGDENAFYYSVYGMADEDIHRCPYPIDSSSFDRIIVDREEFRRSFDLRPGVPLAIVVGKLIPRKTPELILAALRALPVELSLDLVFVGDGPARPQSEELQFDANKRVIVTGFVQPDELPGFYKSADFLVHYARTDHHPLAIAEAVYCGLPLVCSDNLGSIGLTDDVQAHRNALVVPFGSPTFLANAIAKMATDVDMRVRFGHASTAIGSVHAVDMVAERYEEIILTLIPGR
jgi:glycosyltransferase involved in cell wall biosynthesis